jgi:hypothetical protein
MTSKITINIETDDADLAARVSAAFGGVHLLHSSNPAALRSHGASSTACDDQHTPHPDDWSGHNDNGYAEHPMKATEDHAAGNDQTRTAETATDPGTSTNSTGSGAAAGNSAPRDQHGVAFNEHYCSEAQEPFYSSGKRSGQWKKKRGVSDQDYDDWYAEELAELQGGQADTPRGEDDHQPSQVNSAAAFGNGGQEQQRQGGPAPQDTGSFMGWVSEKQAAGLLTQADIQEAYTQTGLQVPDLFPPNDPQTVANNIGKLHGLLAPKAGQ